MPLSNFESLDLIFSLLTRALFLNDGEILRFFEFLLDKRVDSVYKKKQVWKPYNFSTNTVQF
jgi:hypothetical protein